jgi:hypothetical protein
VYLERGVPSAERGVCDLVAVVQEVVDTCRPHLETVGVPLALETKARTLGIVGGRDALAQIILNLHLQRGKIWRPRDSGPRAAREACIRFPQVRRRAGSDRGPGIPPKQREAIFKPFRRLHDSLASGVSCQVRDWGSLRRWAM